MNITARKSLMVGCARWLAVILARCKVIFYYRLPREIFNLYSYFIKVSNSWKIKYLTLGIIIYRLCGLNEVLYGNPIVFYPYGERLQKKSNVFNSYLYDGILSSSFA